MACVTVRLIGGYRLLQDRDGFYVSGYDADAKSTFRRSLHTNDLATAVAIVQSFIDYRGGARMGGVR
ncbi:hypothetical protein [Bradyrhizobium zhanjiangense]|uniref:Uncharacterized protein n=1 Tax=Bradyrhizobium zhanjiangense TaxID=1325107 RepID=A0A4Q0SI81_9BRAD|nr:hypothetical protein [Bradyrhizobium zhanjiangense]RXH37959.1 hypothetical protein XH94_23860 [Bradyrhizobium zhanjiangense]